MSICFNYFLANLLNFLAHGPSISFGSGLQGLFQTSSARLLSWDRMWVRKWELRWLKLPPKSSDFFTERESSWPCSHELHKTSMKERGRRKEGKSLLRHCWPGRRLERVHLWLWHPSYPQDPAKPILARAAWTTEPNMPLAFLQLF